MKPSKEEFNFHGLKKLRRKLKNYRKEIKYCRKLLLFDNAHNLYI